MQYAPRFVLWENVPGVLSTDDNAFGCFLAGLVGADSALVPARGQRWTRAGVVDGPERSAAWRVMDAQYFGLAQRRERVFVVAGARNETHPAEILFEREGVQRYFAPRREAGEDFTHELAPSLTGSGRGVERGGESRGQDPVIAMCLNAKGGGGRIDGESETFVTHALRADGFDASEDGTGRGTPLVPCAIQEDNQNGVCLRDTAGSLRSDAPGTQPCGTLAMVALPILEAGGRTGKSTDDPRAGIGIGEPGDPMYTLQSGKQHAVAFSSKDHGADAGEVAPTLRSIGHDGSHANGGGQIAVALAIRGRDGTPQIEMGGEIANAVLTPNGGRGGIGVGAVMRGMAVRRLTPTECERLQGFKDGHTAITFRGKPAADGPRYKALGNSMAVPCIAFIAGRIAAACQENTPSQ